LKIKFLKELKNYPAVLAIKKTEPGILNFSIPQVSRFFGQCFLHDPSECFYHPWSSNGGSFELLAWRGRVDIEK